jgi:hypothetical protein
MMGVSVKHIDKDLFFKKVKICLWSEGKGLV